MTYESRLSRHVADAESIEWQAHEEALTTFIARAAIRNIGVAVFFVPSAVPTGHTPYPLSFLHERVLEVCRREGALCTDLLPLSQAIHGRATRYLSLWVNRFDPHMGPLANQLAAQQLMKVVAPSVSAGAGLAPRPCSPE